MNKITNKGFGTAPVFFTAISTILGAILFLRFGYAVGTLGFVGVLLIILLGHVVTIPTALAISELASNKRVEGGGDYFIISRSFGLNTGATIGIALYLSQSISVAFYIIAFTEAFTPVFAYLQDHYNIFLPKQAISVPAMLLLTGLILLKGANLGIKALYLVVAVLIVSLVLFFIGETEFALNTGLSLTDTKFRNKDNFFLVFAIIFPAFTGMTAGVGLSGELKKPSKSIPLGTIAATAIGMITYVFVSFKLAASASMADLVGDQLIMSRIAIGGAIAIPLGLAASTISSAIGSVMVAPRTLQAIANDKSFPIPYLNQYLSKERRKDKEPFNASLISCIIAMVFVIMGNVNAVAEIITMFFLVTYGALCLISFLNHFGASPAYRPQFRSKWWLSLIGFVASVWIMFKVNSMYALAAVIVMTITYLIIVSYHRNRKGLEAIFSNALFQINRNLQVYVQKSQKTRKYNEWRPSAICISQDSFKRDKAFELLNWISYKHGFGTYIHLIKGYYSTMTYGQSLEEWDKLLKNTQMTENHVYIDTLISPSYTSAIAQAIQLPGISGMENNMLIFEFDKQNPDNIKNIIDNFSMVKAGKFDICVLGSGSKKINYKNDIHIWIRSIDFENSNLMVLLSFIILSHPNWKNSSIEIFEICKPEKIEETMEKHQELVATGRLPITSKNINIIPEDPNKNVKEVINEFSADAGLTLIGFRGDLLKHMGEQLFLGYDDLGSVLFVCSHSQKDIG